MEVLKKEKSFFGSMKLIALFFLFCIFFANLFFFKTRKSSLAGEHNTIIGPNVKNSHGSNTKKQQLNATIRTI